MGHNMLRINNNGYFFIPDVPKKIRGLKQGNPVLSILYNLTIKPFLCSILTDPLYHGYQIKYLSDHLLYNKAQPLTYKFKILYYEDGVLAFVQDLLHIIRMNIGIVCKKYHGINHASMIRYLIVA
jgi:hypothetical protein